VTRTCSEHRCGQADIDFAAFTPHQAVSTGITSKGDHVDGRVR
jgi:hypothetical protein